MTIQINQTIQTEQCKFFETMSRTLSQSNDYRILKRFDPIKQYNIDIAEAEDNEGTKLIGLYLDTETTGLDYKTDKIIELAIVPFEYSQDGRIFRILDSYSSFQDPEVALDKQITLLTGITNEMVKGQIIDNNKLESMVSSSSIVIAHNAGFDRKFIEKQFSIFKQKPWGCSYTQIPWKEEGISSAKLEYLAYKFGFFYDAHRAEMDCLVGVHLLSQALPKSGDLAFKLLLDKAKGSSYIIWATNSPFSSKDILKNRGYRWNDGNNGKPKAWYIEVSEQTKDAEQDFLFEHIYQAKVKIAVEEINSFNRFSARG